MRDCELCGANRGGRERVAPNGRPGGAEDGRLCRGTPPVGAHYRAVTRDRPYARKIQGPALIRQRGRDESCPYETKKPADLAISGLFLNPAASYFPTALQR